MHTHKPSSPIHGGDTSSAEKHFGAPRDGWLDLSTGINPNPYPDCVPSRAALTNLPTSGDLQNLLQVARRSYGAHETAPICAAPGTQALLQVLPSVINARGPVAVVSPTYNEHAHLWRLGGAPVIEIDDLNQVGDASVVVIVNPNNPDGRISNISTLENLRVALAAKGGLLIIDEAFADVEPEISMVPQAGQDGLLVLRSFGKFFGLAGLRLGFALGTDQLISDLSNRLGPWAVSGAAIEIGSRALADQNWINETRQSLASARQHLDEMVISANLNLVGGTDLFRLTRSETASAVYEKLGRAGILVRAFDDRQDWLRFGLPGSEAEFIRLEEALNR
tara:strand:+ start:11333 stop:12340 length:1008 start_codon:yes stop_codon:yes gene_type:complete